MKSRLLARITDYSSKALFLTLMLQTYAVDCGAQEINRQLLASPQAESPSATLARGVVFLDDNQNGLRDPGEKGVEGCRVSNGQEIVKTDSEGRYELPVDDDCIVFVIKPRGYMTAIDKNKLPRFYYIHKPAGSPPNFQYAGVAPTGPLPESIDFPLTPSQEPEEFRALLFGDTQPRNIEEVEYMAHDVIQQIIAENGHGASLGITLGDIVFDDLSVMPAHNEVVALIGIPWYNVIGNHDINYDAPNDSLSDETFERIYGPAYYSFDHGPVHFIVLDNITWTTGENGEPPRYVGGLGPEQLTFLQNDLAGIPAEQLVVLLMHIPINDVGDRHSLYRMIEQRPAVVSISAHRHFMEHRFIGPEDDWRGKEKHHHIVNVTVCGSWWGGDKDERGIPHATMSDGAPNGYSILQFDGSAYSLEFRAAGRPASYQMNIYAPDKVAVSEVSKTMVRANVFNGCEKTQCHVRVVGSCDWIAMQAAPQVDPAFVAEATRDAQLPTRTWRDLPKPHETPHLWQAEMPTVAATGAHVIEVRVTWPDGSTHTQQRVIRVE